MSGGQLCRKGLGGPDGQRVEHEPATCPCHIDGQWYPGLRWDGCCRQVEGCDPSRLLGAGGAAAGVLCPVLILLSKIGNTEGENLLKQNLELTEL